MVGFSASEPGSGDRGPTGGFVMGLKRRLELHSEEILVIRFGDFSILRAGQTAKR
jgi:hypothetical protein